MNDEIDLERVHRKLFEQPRRWDEAEVSAARVEEAVDALFAASDGRADVTDDELNEIRRDLFGGAP